MASALWQRSTPPPGRKPRSQAPAWLRRIALAPLWVLQIFHLTKSFADNPILGSRTLNRLGLHVARVVLAHLITRLRALCLLPLLPRADRRAFRTQGYIVKCDFLPPAAYQALAAEIRQFEGAEARECIQGDTVTRRTPLDPATLQTLPACRALVQDHRPYRRLLQWTATKFRLPFMFVEQVFNGRQTGAGEDPQKHLHADTFHPTMKSWLFLEDVPATNGPFTYIPGSQRLTLRRLQWEYQLSLAAGQLADGYSRKGSPRLSAPDLDALGLPQPVRFTVPGNTLVIANTFGFHARGPAMPGTTRLALYADSRTNPFNPLPGVNLPWITALQYRLLRRHRQRLDRRAAQHGERSSWHLVRDTRPPA